jgi:carbamoylphosphate synthase large subunit
MATTRKLTCISMNRYRAEAHVQRALGLKVGGTMTEFSVSDGRTDMLIAAWGATPGERSTIAKAAFAARLANEQDVWLRGAQCEARVRWCEGPKVTLEDTWRAEQRRE